MMAPFRTIPKALSVVQPGDTIFIRQGTYPAFDKWDLQGTAENPIVIKAYPGEHVTIDRHMEGSHEYHVIHLRGVPKYLVFEDLEITDSDPLIDTLRQLDLNDSDDFTTLITFHDLLLYRDGIRINRNREGEQPHHLTFKNIEIHHLLGVGYSASGGDHYQFINNHVYDLGWPRSGYGWYVDGVNHLYKGNTVHDCAYGFHINSTSYSIFEDNVVYNNGGPFYHMSSKTLKNNGYGIRIWGGGTGNIIRNNILFENWAGITVISTDTFILNNTLYNNGFSIEMKADMNGLVINNICYNNLTSLNIGDGNRATNNLTYIDPHFMNINNNDFRLQSTSPAIDAGLSHQNVLFDFEGIERPLGKAYDIGAYEYFKPTASQQIPDTWKLSQNHPNPFNMETIIRYQIPEPGNVKITIYNLQGYEMRTLMNEHKNIGFFTSLWDGKSNDGSIVASGVYIYSLEVLTEGKSFIESQKMILIR